MGKKGNRTGSNAASSSGKGGSGKGNSGSGGSGRGGGRGKLIVARNKRARHDYAIEKVYEAGLVLAGTEVKSLRAGRASLQEGYVSIDDNFEAWIENLHIPEYAFGSWTNHAPKRKRKLLMHKTEIVKLKHQLEAKGYTVVPLSLYFWGGKAKLEIALAKGKHLWDKRQALKEKQDNRETSRALKEASR